MSDLMKRAHELAPFVAEALHEVADEATVPDGDEREWTRAQTNSRLFAVDIAESIIKEDATALGMHLIDAVQAHAEAARDAEVNDD